MTAEVQANYPNFKEILSSEKSAKAGRCLANAVSEQQGSKGWQLGH